MDGRRAEEDFQLMQNRIQRLRIEEERAQKNIEDIRKRADEIVSARPRYHPSESNPPLPPPHPPSSPLAILAHLL
jgi:hypothetical protein